MFRYMLGGGDFSSYLISLLLSLPIVFLALSLHESAHGYVAYKLGDPTARNLGRITLNPFKHLNFLGTLCMLLAGFGWANPVPINTRYFKKPRRDMALSALAGPVSNLALAMIFAILLRVLGYGFLMQRMYPTEMAATVASFTVLFLYYEYYLIESGTYSIIDRILHKYLTAGTYSVHLFVSTVSRAKTRRHNYKRCFHNFSLS